MKFNYIHGRYEKPRSIAEAFAHSVLDIDGSIDVQENEKDWKNRATSSRRRGALR